MTSKSEFKGPKGHDFSELAACLRSFMEDEIVFVPNPGNAGDALINLGMYHLFDDLGLKFETGDRDGDYAGKVVIYSGGGALISAYKETDVFFRRVHAHCKALILLPHTVRAYPDLIAEMGENCHLFAREQGSFDYLLEHRTQAHVAHSHDLAFYLDDARIASEPWSGAFLRDSGRWWPWFKMITKLCARGRVSDKVLNAFRTDIEAPGTALPDRNYDMSELFASAQMSRAACGTTIRAMRLVMNQYERIDTNRLHVAVLAGLIGRPVNMRDNSYGKNRSIYDRSITGVYDNVTFL